MASIEVPAGWIDTAGGGFLCRLSGHMSSADALALAEWLAAWADCNPIADAIEAES